MKLATITKTVFTTLALSFVLMGAIHKSALADESAGLESSWTDQDQSLLDQASGDLEEQSLADNNFNNHGNQCKRRCEWNYYQCRTHCFSNYKGNHHKLNYCYDKCFERYKWCERSCKF